MAAAVAEGSSVEGEKLNLKTRQFHVQLPKKDPVSGARRFCFKLGINSEAEVSEALADTTRSIYTNSLLAVGDSIHGETVTGWACKPLGPPYVSKGSGTHSAKYLSISGGCCAVVVIPPREILQSAEAVARNPKIVPLLRKAPAVAEANNDKPSSRSKAQ